MPALTSFSKEQMAELLVERIRREARHAEQLQKAIEYAAKQLHYAGTHGGMSESEAQTVHDQLLLMTQESQP